MLNKKWLLGSFLLLFVMLLSACGSSGLTDEGNNVSKQDWTVENFTATNQDSEPFGLSDLEDEVWLANFIFTSCTTVCLPMSSNISKIQKQLEEEGIEVPLVSFTVDPETDTPEVFKKYGETYGANFQTWHFLTGYPFEEIKKLAETSFKSPVAKPLEGDNQFTHGVLFYLVQSNKIIKTYNGYSDTPIDAIVQDIKVLSDESEEK